MLDKLYSIIKDQRHVVAVIIIIALAGGCTPRKVVEEKEKPRENEPKEKKMRLAEFEQRFNPSDYDKDINIADKPRTDDRPVQHLLEIPKDTMVMQEEEIQGFRIQVFSSSGVDEANLVKNLVHEKFLNDTVYVEYDAPVYKVRVGDFVSRYEANQKLPEFVEKGYKDAWIVPDKIIHRKLVRVSLPK